MAQTYREDFGWEGSIKPMLSVPVMPGDETWFGVLTEAERAQYLTMVHFRAMALERPGSKWGLTGEDTPEDEMQTSAEVIADCDAQLEELRAKARSRIVRT